MQPVIVQDLCACLHEGHGYTQQKRQWSFVRLSLAEFPSGSSAGWSFKTGQQRTAMLDKPLHGKVIRINCGIVRLLQGTQQGTCLTNNGVDNSFRNSVCLGFIEGTILEGHGNLLREVSLVSSLQIDDGRCTVALENYSWVAQLLEIM